MDDSPDPSYDRTDEALLEIAADELEEQTAAFDEIVEKKTSRNALDQLHVETIPIFSMTCKHHRGLDNAVIKLIQSLLRQSE